MKTKTRVARFFMFCFLETCKASSFSFSSNTTTTTTTENIKTTRTTNTKNIFERRRNSPVDINNASINLFDKKFDDENLDRQKVHTHAFSQKGNRFNDPCNIINYVGQSFLANDALVHYDYIINNLGLKTSMFEQINLNGSGEWTIGRFSGFEGDRIARYINGDYCSAISSWRQGLFEIVDTNDPSEHEEMIAFESDTCVYHIEMKCYIPTSTSQPSSFPSNEPSIAPSLLSSTFPSVSVKTTHTVDRDVTIEIETSSEEEEQVADTVENTLTQIIQDSLQQNEDNYEDEHVNGAPEIDVINTVCNGILCYVDFTISSEINCPDGLCNDISIQSVEATFSSWFGNTINQVIDGYDSSSYVTIFIDYALSNGYDSLEDVGSIQFTLDFFNLQGSGIILVEDENVPTATPTASAQIERPVIPPYIYQYLILMVVAVVISIVIAAGLFGLGVLVLLRNLLPPFPDWLIL